MRRRPCCPSVSLSGTVIEICTQSYLTSVRHSMCRISQIFPTARGMVCMPQSHSIHRTGGRAGTQKGPGCYNNRKGIPASLS